MRENRTYGSEGGEAQPSRPLSRNLRPRFHAKPRGHGAGAPLPTLRRHVVAKQFVPMAVEPAKRLGERRHRQYFTGAREQPEAFELGDAVVDLEIDVTAEL